MNYSESVKKLYDTNKERLEKIREFEIKNVEIKQELQECQIKLQHLVEEYATNLKKEVTKIDEKKFSFILEAEIMETHAYKTIADKMVDLNKKYKLNKIEIDHLFELNALDERISMFFQGL